MSEMETQLRPDPLEDELVVHCPICGKSDFGSLQNHLQAHSKQALIDALVTKRDNVGFQVVKPLPTGLLSGDVFGNEDGDRMFGHSHVQSGRRSVSPPKKSHSRGASHSRRRSTAGGRDSSRHAASASSQQPSTSRMAIESIAGNDHGGTLVYEVEIQNLAQNLDPETTEIMPVPICSFSLPPVHSPKSRGEYTESELMRMHVLCPVPETEQEDSDASQTPKSEISHSNFIKYIIDEVIELYEHSCSSSIHNTLFLLELILCCLLNLISDSVWEPADCEARRTNQVDSTGRNDDSCLLVFYEYSFILQEFTGVASKFSAHAR